MGETPARYRQLFRSVKFHRLICEIQPSGPETYRLQLDGPLSLFSATQKYGVQLANFLPTLIQCKRFELHATLRWGAERKEKVFALSHSDGLKSHKVDYGDYLPKELQLFAESFRKSVEGWVLSADADVVALPSGTWVPDYQLVHQATGEVVRLEILGFWRRTDADKLFKRLKSELGGPFIIAASEQFNIDEITADEANEHIYRFKRTPLPAEIVKLAEAQLKSVKPKSSGRRTSR
jgi:predicted nuclease of restriction endonuclease-like RecB superfamily